MIAVTLRRAGGDDRAAMSAMSPARPRRRIAEPALPHLGRLAARLEGLGCCVAELETPRGARALLVDRNGSARTAIVPAALADRSDDLFEQVVRMLRDLAPRRPLVPLAFGEATDTAVRARLRDAAIELAIHETMDDDLLRFQINRALATGPLPARVARRAPMRREVAVRHHLLTRSIPVYTLSSSGAFLLTDRPLAPGRRVRLEFSVGRLRARARARVVLANPAGPRADLALPPGMAVAFEDLDGPCAAVLDRLVDERLAGLAV